VWVPPISVLLRRLSGGSWLPHLALGGAAKLLTALFYATTVRVKPARADFAES